MHHKRILLIILIFEEKEETNNCYILVRVLQRNRINIMWIYRERRNWLLWLWRLTSPSLPCGLAAWSPRRTDGAVPVWRQSTEEFPVPWGGQSFHSIRASTDCMRPIYIMEGKLLTQSLLILKVNLIPRTLQVDTWNWPTHVEYLLCVRLF